MLYIAYLILALSAVNLFRIAIFLMASDLFDIRNQLASRQKKPNRAVQRPLSTAYTPKRGFPILRPMALAKALKPAKKKAYRPLVTVLVPAHNEEKTLLRNLESIANSSYKNVELIIINDSSTDRTYQIARKFQRQNKDSFKRVKVLSVNVRGKARALNAGLKHANGKLFMCLDADSALTAQALEYGVEQFRNRRVVSLCSNVKIFPAKGMLNLFQRIEYLICYQMKKAETLTNTQYIVGGIGSMFRTSVVRKLGGYDTDTITEDIDLSMSIIGKHGNKIKIGYDPRMVVFTEAVHDIKGLLQQRYRWKYGRYQVFLKQKDLFWSRSDRQNPVLTWLYLPYALFAELAYAIEPLTFAMMFYLIATFGDASMIVSSFIVFLFYTTIQVSGATTGYSLKERARLIALAPIAYFGMYILSFVEYVATVRGLANTKKLIVDYRNGGGSCEWQHVERAGTVS